MKLVKKWNAGKSFAGTAATGKRPFFEKPAGF
jgi:hypothetical protein